MFNEGLSLDQAPPISVPFRFFLTAPIFAIIIGVLILTNDASLLLNRYSDIAIAIVHLFTLGILSMIIVGAMQQMMPVLAGAVIKKPILFANTVHTTLTLGTILFALYFILHLKILLMIATALLGLSFLTFFIVSIRLLFKVKFLNSTVIAMRIFVVVGLITILLGLHLAGSHIADNIGQTHYSIVSIHILFGIFGFATLIIMGVAFQVIPMFYVAKSFPKFIENRVPFIIVFLLLVYTLFEFASFDLTIVKLSFVIFISAFAYFGIHSLNNRKRPIFDVTLLYWKTSLYMLIIGLFVWFFAKEDVSYLLSILFGLGFLFSLLQGMIYKIIPFLCWFHLTSKGYFTVPTMRELIVENMIRIQFYMYMSSLVFFILAFFLTPIFIYIAAGLFIFSNLFFLFNLILALKKYNEIAKTDPMDMSSFQMPS
ncbi:hypothetical protein [Arcobacter sp. LA11]|uniref:hypothetical protein n=1 Tax=Arcobacter sp. LA11 TaxID=1898176 RepID=UPI00093231DB|nr:hypothetical protein [Arcobacter sp. LA11]